MDPIKEAFAKIKQDISLLLDEISSLKKEIALLKNKTNDAFTPADLSSKPGNSTNSPTVPQEIRGLNMHNNELSTGNKGVPTDISTYSQTIQQTDISSRNDDFEALFKSLESLDTFKKELRIKFKRLTKQEMQVFNTIYRLEDQNIEEISYKTIASYMNLSESSIRDYVNKIIEKRIPIQKRKIDNKKVVLSISPNLKKIVSLSTINQLRDI